MPRSEDGILSTGLAGKARGVGSSGRPRMGRWPVVYASLAILEGVLALALGGWWWWLLWPALAHAGLALAFALRAPSLFGKQADGGLRLVPSLIFLPYLIFLLAFFHAKRRLLSGREDCCNEVADGIYVGRRPLAGEMPSDVGLVVDLMAELPETRAALAAAPYVCLPTLNRIVPEDQPFRRLILRLAREARPVYIHCGAGKGRSATVAAALLIAKGLASDVEGAIEILQASRPIVHLHPVQQELVRRFSHSLSS